MFLGEYDMNLLQKARGLLLEAYEYNYGEPSMRSTVNRLETIIKKIDYLIETNDKEKRK